MLEHLKFNLALIVATVAINAMQVVIPNCSIDQKPIQTSLRPLIDSIVTVKMIEGRYTLVSRFFNDVAGRRLGNSSLTPPTELCQFFAGLNPLARIEDSAQVAQLIELAYNNFTMMDNNAVYVTVGDADTYSAWYLQRVLGIRKDVLVVALPFLMGLDYRQELASDVHARRAFGESFTDSLPTPPTTAETDSSRRFLIQRWLLSGQQVPLYFSPSSGLEDEADGNIIYVGLIHAYRDSTRNPSSVLTYLLSTMKKSWRLTEASRVMPPTEQAIKNGMIQYLTLAMMMGSEFHQTGKTSELLEFFEILDPICSGDWQFNALRYSYHSGSDADCRKFLSRVKDYARKHPDDTGAHRYLEQLKSPFFSH